MSESILDIKYLTISFFGFKAVNNVNTTIKKGDIHFFIGPNGAGKTTLLDAICGRVKAQSGKIIFKGKLDITKHKEYEIANMGIGRKFQVPSVFNGLSVWENMEIAASKSNSLYSVIFSKLSKIEIEQVKNILDMIGLYEKRNVTPKQLSHGEKQWLEIGMLLAQKPEVMLLDEPVAGLGKSETEKTAILLKKIAKTCSIVVVEHDMDFMKKIATKVTVLHEGSILAEGTVDEIQNNEKVIAVYLGRGGARSA